MYSHLDYECLHSWRPIPSLPRMSECIRCGDLRGPLSALLRLAAEREVRDRQTIDRLNRELNRPMAIDWPMVGGWLLILLSGLICWLGVYGLLHLRHVI